MIADRIKTLRELNGLTQTDLAKYLGITRSSVNAWELGISIPSTQYIVKLSQIFKISTDYLLCVENTATISIADLSEKDVKFICTVIAHLRDNK